MSTIKANQWLNPDGTENYKCRAWLSFNGITNTIINSKNIISFTDRGAGLYSFIMENPVADATYCVIVSGGASQSYIDTSIAQTTSTFHTRHTNSAGTEVDTSLVSAAVFA